MKQSNKKISKYQELNHSLGKPPDRSELASLVAPAPAARLKKQIEAWNEQVVHEGWSVRMPVDFAQRPALKMGHEILEHAGSLIVGMSLGNSYFSSENITKLFRFLQTLDVVVYLLVMDLPNEHNYRALGYSEKKIAEKIKKKSAKMFRDIDTAFELLGNSDGKFRILSWDNIREHKDFQHARQDLESLYGRNDYFRNELRETVAAYLMPKLNGVIMSDEIHQIADRYLLEEFAFLTHSQKIIGCNESAYLYHKPWPIFERLIAGTYEEKPFKNLGFIELSICE